MVKRVQLQKGMQSGFIQVAEAVVGGPVMEAGGGSPLRGGKVNRRRLALV